MIIEVPKVEKVTPPADLLAQCKLPETPPLDDNGRLVDSYLDILASFKTCSEQNESLREWFNDESF